MIVIAAFAIDHGVDKIVDHETLHVERKGNIRPSGHCRTGFCAPRAPSEQSQGADIVLRQIDAEHHAQPHAIDARIGDLAGRFILAHAAAVMPVGQGGEAMRQDYACLLYTSPSPRDS